MELRTQEALIDVFEDGAAFTAPVLWFADEADADKCTGKGKDEPACSGGTPGYLTFGIDRESGEQNAEVTLYKQSQTLLM